MILRQCGTAVKPFDSRDLWPRSRQVTLAKYRLRNWIFERDLPCHAL